MGETIGEIATKLLENKLKSKDTSGEGILCVGTKGSGKTTLLNVFLDKDEPNPRETLSLEYTFGRKTVVGQYGDKKICHVWELGGAMLPTKELMCIPSTGGGATVALLMVDLSQGLSLWPQLREYATKLYESSPLPLYIVGGKYEIYRQLDVKQRMQVNKILRMAALITGGGVFMFTNADTTLVRRAKEILNQLSFGHGGPGGLIKTYLGDSERPLQIAPGRRDDSWEALGFGGPLGWSDMDRWIGELTLGNDIKSTMTTIVTPPDPSLEVSYREPLIDALRTQKDHQLQLAVASRGQSYF